MKETNSSDKQVAEINDIMEWAGLAAPFIIMLALSPLNFDHFGLPKLTALYLTALLLIYFQIRKWLIIGVASIVIRPIHLISIAILVIAVASTLASPNPLTSLIGRFNRYENLPALFCYAILLWFSFKSARNSAFEGRFNRIFVPFFFLITAYGMLELLGVTIFNSPLHADNRISSTFGNPVFFGGFLAMSLPLLLARAISTYSSSKSILDNRFTYIFLVCLGLLALFATVSRGAWAGAAASMLSVLYIRYKAGGVSQAKFHFWMVVALICGISIILAAYTLGASLFPDLLDAVKSPRSLENRVEIWKSSLHMISDRPLLGYGLDQTKDWFGSYMTIELARLENALHDRAHNIFIQTAADGGVLFLLAQLWLFVYAVSSGLKALRRRGNYMILGLIGAVAGYVAQGFTGIATHDLNAFLCLIFGSITGLAAKENMYPLKAYNINIKPFAMKAVSAFLVILIILTPMPLLIEARYNGLYNEAAAVMSQSSLEDLLMAGKLLAAQPYYQYYIARLCLNFAKERGDAAYAKIAARAASQGLKYTPNSLELAYIIGSSYLAAAHYGGDKTDLEMAGAYLEQARRKMPMFLWLYDDLLKYHIQIGAYDEAIRDADLVISINEENAVAYVAKSVIYQLKGDNKTATKLFKKAVSIDPQANEIKKYLQPQERLK